MNKLIKISDIDSTVIEEKNNVSFISYNSLNKLEWITNAFSTRIGGVSKAPYNDMNLSFTLGDDEENVLKNFKIMADAIEFDVNDMVYSHQTHTNNVMRVDDSHKGMGILKQRNYHDIDGIVTNTPGLCLVTSYADCVPLYFVDPVNKAIGLSHSGWRGTVSNICKNTIELMKNEFGSKSSDLICCIGPSICAECYEVSEDVINEFEKNYSKDQFLTFVYKKNNGKYKLDLHKANYYNMINEGVLSENISMPDVCTCCNDSILHSHRASKGKRGGLCAFLAINKE